MPYLPIGAGVDCMTVLSGTSKSYPLITRTSDTLSAKSSSPCMSSSTFSICLAWCKKEEKKGEKRKKKRKEKKRRKRKRKRNCKRDGWQHVCKHQTRLCGDLLQETTQSWSRNNCVQGHSHFSWHCKRRKKLG